MFSRNSPYPASRMAQKPGNCPLSVEEGVTILLSVTSSDIDRIQNSFISKFVIICNKILKIPPQLKGVTTRGVARSNKVGWTIRGGMGKE